MAMSVLSCLIATTNYACYHAPSSAQTQVPLDPAADRLRLSRRDLFSTNLTFRLSSFSCSARRILEVPEDTSLCSMSQSDCAVAW